MKRPDETSIEKKKSHLIRDVTQNKYNMDPMSNSAAAPFQKINKIGTRSWHPKTEIPMVFSSFNKLNIAMVLVLHIYC